MTKTVKIALILAGLVIVSALSLLVLINRKDNSSSLLIEANAPLKPNIGPTEEETIQKARTIIEKLPDVSSFLRSTPGRTEYIWVESSYFELRQYLPDTNDVFEFGFEVDTDSASATLVEAAPHRFSSYIEALYLTEDYIRSNQSQKGQLFTYEVHTSAEGADLFTILVFGYEDSINDEPVSQDFYDVVLDPPSVEVLKDCL